MAEAPGSTPASKRRGRGRKRTASAAAGQGTTITQILADLIAEHKTNRKTQGAEDLYFKACAETIRKLSPDTSTLLMLQISELFYNAQNPRRQVAVTPFPCPTDPEDPTPRETQPKAGPSKGPQPQAPRRRYHDLENSSGPSQPSVRTPRIQPHMRHYYEEDDPYDGSSEMVAAAIQLSNM